MDMLILGAGNLGRAVAAARLERGEPAARLVGRPASASGRHDAATLLAGTAGTAGNVDHAGAADVVVEASLAEAVAPNLTAAVAAGARRFVIATTGWERDRPWIEALLRDHGAAAVAAPNFSLGVVLFGRLVETAARLFGPLPDVDPYMVEWHRRTKVDRPSGTARELAQRIIAAHPRKRRLADPTASGPPAPDELELAVVRAGASPGMHLVGFDAPGETVELRLTARDRSAYAAGILAAADWLWREPRSAGLHAFDQVVDELLLEAVA